MMSSQEEFLNFIENISEQWQTKEVDPAIVQKLASCDDSLIRNIIAKKLFFFDSDIAEPILLRLLKDSDRLVRVNACDSLCISHSEKTRDILLDIGENGDYLMRGFAILSATDITIGNGFDHTPVVEFLNRRIKKEKSTWVKINCYTALYQLGETKYLQFLFVELDNRYYRNRCLVVNSLSNIVDDRNKKQIQKKLKERLQKEKARSVKMSIQDTLTALEEYLNT